MPPAMSSSWAARAKKLAPLSIGFVGVKNGEKVLDVGCGTGSLTFALARAADVGEVAAVDYSPVFVEEAIRRNTDPRVTIRQADACALQAHALIRAIPLSEAPPSTASSLFARPERSTQIL